MGRLAGLLALILLFGGGWLVLDGAVAPGVPFAGSPGDDPTTSAPSDDPSDEPSEDPGDEPGADDCNPQDAAMEYLDDHAFERDDYSMGAGVMDWSLLDTGHTRYPFSESLQSESAVRTFLSGDNRAARAARRLAPVADDYVPVQFNQGIRYAENWHWTGRKAIKGGDKRVRSGDIWWLAINDDCEVVEDSSIRAICGNPGVYWLRPAVDPRK